MSSKRQAIQQVARETAERDRRLRDDLYAQSQPITNPGSGGGSGGAFTIVNLTAGTYNAAQTSGRHLLLCDCSAGNVTVNLPPIASNTAEFQIKKTDASANTVTIDGSGAETIEDGATAVILVQYAVVGLVAGSATNWSGV